MSRKRLLPLIADEVSTIVAGALAANGEDDGAYWEFVQKLRHKYGLSLLTEAQVQDGIQQYSALTHAQESTKVISANSDARDEWSEDRNPTATRADLRAVVLVEAVLSSGSTLLIQTVQETNTLLTQLGSSLNKLNHKGLLSSNLVERIQASGYRFAENGLAQPGPGKSTPEM